MNTETPPRRTPPSYRQPDTEAWELIGHAMIIGNGRRYRKGIGRRLAQLGLGPSPRGYLPFEQVIQYASMAGTAISLMNPASRQLLLARAAITILTRDEGGRT